MEIISSIYNSGYNIKKFYLGSQELKLAFLGNQVIYDEVVGDNDLNYIFYEFYKSDTLSNTVEAPFKSAILKGQTLVNLVGEDKKRNILADGKDIRVLTEFSGSKEYTVYFKVEQINNNGLIRLQYFNGLTFISGENKNIVVGVNTITFTTPANTTNIRFQNANGVTELIIDDLMILEGNYTNVDITYFVGMQSVKMPVLTTTNGEPEFIEVDGEQVPNEAFKSNILTVNEDVELRGIGNVKDELNILTGELTQRVGEIVLDGSESWEYHLQTNTDTIAYRTPVRGTSPYSPILCDRFINVFNDSDTEHCFIGTSSIAIFINRSRLSTVNTTGFKEYLQANPLTIQYRLANESIKTVDLTMVDQDEQTISKLNSFNGTTHVSTEVAENSIYPTIAIEVATE